MKRKHIWQKAFSLSFAFHLVMIITVGSMVAGFHKEIQRPQEQFITVNLADTPEETETAQENMTPFNSLKEMLSPNSADSSEAVKNTEKQSDSTPQQNIKNTAVSSDYKETVNNAGQISSPDGILPSAKNSSGSGGFSAESSGNMSDGEEKGDGTGGSGESYSSENADGDGSGSGATEDRYSVASRFAQAVEANKSYPYAAVRLNQQGVVTVNVTLDAGGNLVSASIVSSAGKNLDKAALNAVYASCPFSHGLNDSINMDVPVHFYLN